MFVAFSRGIDLLIYFVALSLVTDLFIRCRIVALSHCRLCRNLKICQNPASLLRIPETLQI